ncbi:hypothetical protein NW767_15839 [Fusarium falciforme]|nr:hypothetical protein NW767_15839 [Fusarium falciforme]KAJ4231188.1 hypothetical protein NW757_14869 [Fusarium falciforme]
MPSFIHSPIGEGVWAACDPIQAKLRPEPPGDDFGNRTSLRSHGGDKGIGSEY